MIEIQPERFTTVQDEATRREALDKLVASGLRAQLKSGNLLTGQLIVSLDIFKNAKPAQIVWSGPVPEIPTVPDAARGDHGQRRGPGRPAQPLPGRSDRQGAERLDQGAARHAGGSRDARSPRPTR